MRFLVSAYRLICWFAECVRWFLIWKVLAIIFVLLVLLIVILNMIGFIFLKMAAIKRFIFFSSIGWRVILIIVLKWRRRCSIRVWSSGYWILSIYCLAIRLKYVISIKNLVIVTFFAVIVVKYGRSWRFMIILNYSNNLNNFMLIYDKFFRS